MSREATGKARKEQYYDQLPLQPGRKVAFKVPNKGKDKAEDETGEEAWILATIRKCINQDKMRYEVQDADDANTSVAADLLAFSFSFHRRCRCHSSLFIPPSLPPDTVQTSSLPTRPCHGFSPLAPFSTSTALAFSSSSSSTDPTPALLISLSILRVRSPLPRTPAPPRPADSPRSWNTTLRSIIPLPDPSAPPSSSANPSNLEDYPKGTQVLGLYPETTSFYRATVVAPPLPGTGHGLGVRFGSRLEEGAEKEHYLLLFVDDDDKMSVVHKDLVLLVSATLAG